MNSTMAPDEQKTIRSAPAQPTRPELRPAARVPQPVNADTAEKQHAFTVRNLSVYFGTNHVLKNVSIDAQRNEFFRIRER